VSSHAQGRAKKHATPILAALTVALGLFALAGCGSSSSPTATTASTPATTPTSSPSTTTSATTTTTTNTPASSGAAAGGALTLEANREGALSYNKTSLTASAGKVSIDFTNMSPLGHNMTIESSSGKVVGATPTFQGGSKTLTVDLKAGTYKFFCSVPGHRMAGMEGTLTVK
jgi:plastocyanin